MSKKTEKALDRLATFGFTKYYIRKKAGFMSRQAYHYHLALSEHDSTNETILREKILSALINIKKETAKVLNEEIENLKS